MWTLSVTSFTCLYTVVTLRIILWTNWWTEYNIVICSIFSICLYIIYVWVSNIIWFSSVTHTIVILHQSPLFWLSILLTGGIEVCRHTLMEQIRLHFYKNGSDWCREKVKEKIEQTI